MRRLARLFSALVLIALVGAAALLWVRPAPPPARAPDQPPEIALSGPLDLIPVSYTHLTLPTSDLV